MGDPFLLHFSQRVSFNPGVTVSPWPRQPPTLTRKPSELAQTPKDRCRPEAVVDDRSLSGIPTSAHLVEARGPKSGGALWFGARERRDKAVEKREQQLDAVASQKSKRQRRERLQHAGALSGLCI